jgi:hypothetical protein
MDFQGYFNTAFKNVKFEGLENFNLSTFDLYEKSSIQISLPPSVSENEEFYLNSLFEAIRNQISLDAQKRILESIHKTPSMYFIDIMSSQEKSKSNLLTDYDTHFSLVRGLTSQVLRLNVRNIVSNGKILSEYIVDSPAFSQEPLSNKLSTSNTFIKYGKLSNINIYMDSFMKWNDDFILSYDDIYYHIKDLSLDITSDSRFAPLLNVSFNFAFRVDNPGKIWVVNDINSSGYVHYKSTLRDQKIDNLLN